MGMHPTDKMEKERHSLSRRQSRQLSSTSQLKILHPNNLNPRLKRLPR